RTPPACWAGQRSTGWCWKSSPPGRPGWRRRSFGSPAATDSSQLRSRQNEHAGGSTPEDAVPGRVEAVPPHQVELHLCAVGSLDAADGDAVRAGADEPANAWPSGRTGTDHHRCGDLVDLLAVFVGDRALRGPTGGARFETAP